MAVSWPVLDEMLASAQRRALHLEMRDDYAGASPGFVPWMTGQPYDYAGPNAQWHAIVRPLLARGVDVRRARIVSEPASDYIRYEHQATPAASLDAGERVRWLPRRHASDLALPGNDLWLVDDQVAFNHFSGGGEWIDVEVVGDPAVVKFCASAFEAVWERAIDHQDYHPA